MPDNPRPAPLDLAAIRARLAAATPGPWRRATRTWDGSPIRTVEALDGEGGTAEVAMEPTGFYVYPSHSWVTPEGEEANLELIAHAPTDLVAACDEIDCLTTALASARETIRALTDANRELTERSEARARVIGEQLKEADRLREILHGELCACAVDGDCGTEPGLHDPSCPYRERLEADDAKEGQS